MFVNLWQRQSGTQCSNLTSVLSVLSSIKLRYRFCSYLDFIPVFNVICIQDELKEIDTSNTASITKLPVSLYNKEKAVNFYHRILAGKNKREELLVRDDYRELAVTSLALLGEETPVNQLVWKKCGGTHKARFCTYGIYANIGLQQLA